MRRLSHFYSRDGLLRRTLLDEWGMSLARSGRRAGLFLLYFSCFASVARRSKSGSRPKRRDSINNSCFNLCTASVVQW